MPELVGQGHEGHAADAGLEIFFGQVGRAPVKDRPQHGVERAHRRLDRNDIVAHAQQARTCDGIVQTVLTGEARGHHHAPDAVRAQCIDRDGGGKRRVDSAGQAQHYARKTVAVHIIAQPQHHGVVDIRRTRIEFMPVAGQADPLTIPLLPLRQNKRLFPVGQLLRDGKIGIHDEGRAIEHQLILSAHPVEIG